MEEIRDKKEKTPVKISLVEWLLIIMSCISIALGGIYFILN